MRRGAFDGYVPHLANPPVLRFRVLTYLLILAGVIALVIQPAKGILLPAAILVVSVGVLVIFLSTRQRVNLRYLGGVVSSVLIMAVALVYLVAHFQLSVTSPVGVAVVYVLFWAPIATAFLAGFATYDRPQFVMVGEFRIDKPRRTLILAFGVLGQLVAVALIALVSSGEGDTWGGVVFGALTFGAALAWTTAIPFYLEGRALGERHAQT